jgi:hypothetical protein
MFNRTKTPSQEAKADFADLSIALVAGVAFAFTAVFLCAAPMTNQISAGRDFVAYWATGQQLVQHANPFDTAAMTKIEHGAGLSDKYTVGFMRNPPWGLALAFPLGYVGLKTGTLLWSLIMLGCLTFSAHMLWRMHGSPRGSLHWLGYSFAPAVLCLWMGQTSLFVLLGWVLFLRLESSRPFLAGMSLWLCTLKPHFFVPFALVLLASMILTRNFKILAGAAAALGASIAIVYWMDPLAFSQYAEMIRTVGMEKEFIPCLSVVLRLWISPASKWLQSLPTAVACVWALIYYWPRRRSWDWMREGSLLMLVSIFAAPYCWLYDQGLAIPAVLEGAYRTRSRILIAVIALASLPVEIMLLCGVRITSAAYLWTSAAWLIWYLCATASRFTRKMAVESNGTAVNQAI